MWCLQRRLQVLVGRASDVVCHHLGVRRRLPGVRLAAAAPIHWLRGVTELRQVARFGISASVLALELRVQVDFSAVDTSQHVLLLDAKVDELFL